MFNSLFLGRKAPPFDPASLDLSGWWRNYGGANPWTGTSSLGTSGNGSTYNFTSGTFPANGTALNGYGTANFVNASFDYIDSSNCSNFFTTTNFSMWALVNVASIGTNDAGTWSNNATILCSDAGDQIGLYLRSGGGSPVAGLGIYTGSDHSVEVAINTGVWMLLQARGDGANIEIRRDSGAWQSAGGGTISSLTYALEMGRGPSQQAGSFLDALVADVATSKTKYNDSQFSSIVDAVNLRYGLSL